MKASSPIHLPECDGSWPVAVGLLDSAGGWRTLASGLGGELLARGFASGGLPGGLFGSGHLEFLFSTS